MATASFSLLLKSAESEPAVCVWGGQGTAVKARVRPEDILVSQWWKPRLKSTFNRGPQTSKDLS